MIIVYDPYVRFLKIDFVLYTQVLNIFAFDWLLMKKKLEISPIFLGFAWKDLEKPFLPSPDNHMYVCGVIQGGTIKTL